MVKATEVKNRTESLYKYLDELKLRIVRQADGKDGNVNDIVHQDDLEAASYIMLSPRTGERVKTQNGIGAIQ